MSTRTAYLAFLDNTGNKFHWPTVYEIAFLTRIQALLRICDTCFTYPAMINTFFFTIHTQKKESLRERTICNKQTTQPIAKKLPFSVPYHNYKSFVIGMKQCTKVWNESTVVWKKYWSRTGTYKFKTNLSMATHPNIALFWTSGSHFFHFFP